MPRGRRYDDDTWSDDSDYDDYRIREIAKKVHRSHSRHNNHRSPQHEEPVINYFENKLYVPGQDQQRSRSRSRSRGGSYSGERDPTTELLLAQLALQKEDKYDREEEHYKHKYEEEKRRKEYEWQMEDKRRADERRREDLKREIEEEKRKREDEYKQALLDAAAKEKEEKLKREKLAAEFKAEEAKKKREAKEQEERILLEAEFKKKEAAAEAEATRKRVLHEIELEKQKKEAEKKEKEKEFEEMIRERAIRHGMDPDKAVRQFKDVPATNNDRQVGVVRRSGFRRRVKVRRDHILPQTLDSYKLTWKYYEDNPEYIIIEDEVDDDFLYELQTDSERIIKSRKLITPGYKKETITTLTPGGSNDSIRKKGGKYYMVRKRSVSRSRFGISDLI